MGSEKKEINNISYKYFIEAKAVISQMHLIYFVSHMFIYVNICTYLYLHKHELNIFHEFPYPLTHNTSGIDFVNYIAMLII